MNVQTLLAALFGALAGYLVGRRHPTSVLVKHDLKIQVQKENGNYTSETTRQKQKVRGRDEVVWVIHDRGHHELPKSSIVKLKFTIGSPLTDEEPQDGGTRVIESSVRPGLERRPYPYKIYYSVGGRDVLMEDPELIIEGDRR